MGVLSPLQRTLESRCLVYYRADPAVVAGLLPERIRPSVYRGQALVGLCWTRCVPLGQKLLPRRGSRGGGGRAGLEHWDELAFCFPVEPHGAGRSAPKRPERPERKVWIDRRETSPGFAAHWIGRLVRDGAEPARFEVEDHAGGLELLVRHGDAEELRLVAEVAEEPLGSLFLSVRQVEEYLERSGSLHPRNPFVPEAPPLSVGAAANGGGWGLEPLTVRELACPYFEDEARFPSGSLTLDSAFRLVRRRARLVKDVRPSASLGFGEAALPV